MIEFFFQKRRFLLVLAHNLPSESPLSKEWPNAPKRLREANVLLRRLYHQWRVRNTSTYLQKNKYFFAHSIKSS